MQVLIIGAGIGGLTAALALHARGIGVRVVEAAPEIRPLGVGINILPHATAQLAELGVLERLEAVSIATREAAYFNRFGNLILTEPLGRFAGYRSPQLSIHRGTLQAELLAALRERAGAAVVETGWRCVGVEPEAGRARFVDETGSARETLAADAIIASDGIHSSVRAQFFPGEGGPIYSGVMMWRGVTRMAPMLSGATMVRAGWLTNGKMVIYPIRNHPDGTQEMNWVAEIVRPWDGRNDWSRPGRAEDFVPHFEDWRFEWCDVPAMMRAAPAIFEYPMVDKDPLPSWTQGRVTLLGDAAHPMYPRGSNGAGQAILDARALADALAADADAPRALLAYEEARREATAQVVRTNRISPPDVIIQKVWEKTGDRPFARIEDVMPREELEIHLTRYKQVAGYDMAKLGAA
jgi:2-polyprenyl-6-methoxyphenol hydroxylase-like FAD-dependent oxidoreductase